MKVNNFSELDKVLKKSFSKIKDDLDKSKKELDKKLKDGEKKQKNSLDLVNTKIKFVSDEIKKFKNYKNEIVNEQKTGLKKLKAEQKTNREQLKEDYKQELEKIKKDTSKLKDNFLKVMDVLKEKLVTKKSFEENNKVVEKAINDLITKTKDIDQIKFNYFSKLNVNRQLSNVQGDFKEFKEDFYKVKETIAALEEAKQQFTEFKEVSNTKFVEEGVFLNKTKELGELKENFEELRTKIARLGEQNSSSVDIHLFNNEIEDIRKRLSMINEIKDQSENFVNKEELTQQTSDVENLKGKQELLIDELKSLKEQVNENTELKNELEKLKNQIDKSQHKIEKNSVMIDMVRDTSSTVKKVQEEKVEEAPVKVEEPKEFELEDPFKVEEKEGSGLFKRTLKGIADFFLEEEEEDVFNFEESKPMDKEYSETLSGSQVTYKSEPTIGDTKFVAEIEKMFDEKSETPELNLKLEEEDSESILNKIKTGVVNFFFEEEEDDEFVFQSEEIEKEDVAKLEQPEEMPKVEIVEEPVKKKRGRKPKVETEAPEEEKKVHYMKSKKPRIFQDIKEEEESTVDSEVDSLAKSKKKDKKASASLAEEDYVYYPEDYFY